MIIIKLQGGLGNQMFQYAFGRALEMQKVRKGEQVQIKFDANYYLNKEFKNVDTPRYYLLDKFNTKITFAKSEEIFALNPPLKKFLIKAKNKVFGAFCKKNPYLFDPKEFEIKDNSYIFGYWQTEKYFKSIEKEIKAELTLKNSFNLDSQKVFNKIQSDEKSEKETVSIHIRRTDYVNMKVNSEFFGTCSIEYYQKAVRELESRLKLAGQEGKALELYIFSDDIKWAKENLKFTLSEPGDRSASPALCPMTFVSCPEIPDYEEMILMSKCKHNIIANSSFSWWAAWLNKNPEKIVIAPEKWLSNSKIKTPDVLPDTWIKV
ncbi:MAG: alpha-1,2-fucosyltransferase [Candidatus Taylorbacteria bacterium]|nr:alpha-1,2-fucosyltransferase [Candidatus Taylorbacteria bacterium]